MRSVFGPSASSILPKIWRWGIDLSRKYIKTAPRKKPIAGGRKEGSVDKPNSFWISTAEIAGDNNDQKLAAIITPPVNPNAASKNFLLVVLKKKTRPAPIAVRIQVNNPAYNAWVIGDDCEAKKSTIVFIF